MSGCELAEKAGLSPATIFHLETGEYAPNVVTLIKIIKVLKVTFEELCAKIT